MPGVVLPSRLSTRMSRPSERLGPDPAFLEGLYATAVESAGTAEIRETQRNEARNGALDDIVEGLQQRGFAADYRQRVLGIPVGYDEGAIWRDLAAARERDPKFFTPYATGADALDADLNRRFAPAPDSNAEVASRTKGAASLIGNLWGGAADPVNTGTMFLGAGAGKTLLQTMWQEAKLNAGIELMQQPSRVVERGLRGQETTAGQALTEVALAGGAGAAFGALGKVGERAAPVIGDALASGREKALARVYDVLPPAFQQRWKESGEIPDEALPDALEALVGRSNMSEDERAAVAVARREAEIARANPFEPNGAGVAAHRERMAEAMSRILSNAPPAPVRTRLAGDTAISSGTVAPRASQGTVDTVFDALVHQESGGRRGVPGVMTQYGQAHGLTQMLDSTAAAVAKRIGEPWRPELMRGQSDAAAAYQLKLGRAYFEEGLARYGGDVRKALHFYHGGPNERLWGAKTRAYADAILARSGGGDVRVRADVVPGAEVARAQADLDRLRAERFELEQVTAQSGRDGADGEEPTPWAREVEPVAGVDMDDAALIPSSIDAREGVAAETAMLLPKLREIVADRGRSINQLASIAEELGVPEARVRDALTELAKGREVRMKTVKAKDGTLSQQFARQPVDAGPIDALKFIARIGVSDDGGHALAKGRESALTGKARTGRDLQRFVPGAGPLIRKGGKSVDEIGEQLWDAGYFGPPSAVARPDVDTVLQFIERAATGEKLFPIGAVMPDAEVPAGVGRFIDPAEREWFVGKFEHAAEDLGVSVDDGLFEAAVKVYDGMDPETASHRVALIQALNDEFDAIRLDVWHETGNDHYAALDDDFAGSFREAEGVGRDMGGRPELVAGDAGARGAAGQGADPEGLSALSSEARTAFLDPDGAAAKAQADSLAHDARMLLDRGAETDPAIAAKQRQQGELGAAAPLAAKVDQDSTIGAPLFDAADQTRFRLDDGDGEGKTIAEIMADLDAEEAAIKTVRDCL
ncbi:hypothetical protein [Sphingomonas alpina]|uniref:Transglycosylase SLT domain-containing protein n=1 Tax=Sphingomonas alpina TaxID=653931 RepID=A0A7H0LHU1_9SPHN|nr:hypothetical protein [Sphingomonas alpina]QNQ09244.1 hypothetical protein H3Z74_21660 [Sphingomonas alpina]